MKPTAHIAKSAATPKTGRFALLRGPHRAPGSGASARGSLVTSRMVLCVLFGLLVLCTAAAAQAEPPRLVPNGSLAVHFADGIAVDQASGDLYVAGINSESGTPIDKFDSAGNLISPPSPFGTNFEAGVAVNPHNGDLYVLNFSGSIQTFDPNTGALIGEPFPVPLSGEAFERLLQIAADAAGNVYLPSPSENAVLEYSPTGTLLETFTGGSGGGALLRPTGVAVDAAGNLWVADTGNNRIEELSPADAPLGTIKSEGVASIALDGHGDVFAIVNNGADSCGAHEPPCTHLVEYNAAGVQVADVGAGLFGALNMPAVNEATGRVYVTDPFAGKVWIFQPPAPPTVSKELSAEVRTSEAKLGALVNPGGIQTSYRFEYGPTAAYGQSTPFPEGSVGEGLTSRAVWASASGLAPDTTYHYRVVATNELGQEVGPDQTFTTETAEQAACPNEAFRGGFSARLPDCRAYELVTPPNKSSVQFNSSLNRKASTVASSGSAISLYTSEPPPSGAPTSGRFYVATRSPSGWNLEDVSPVESYSGVLCLNQNNELNAWSAELSRAVIELGRSTRDSQPSNTGVSGGACNSEGLQVTPAEPVGYQNLLLRENSTGTFRLINTPPPGVTPADANFRGASADLSTVVFSEQAPLTPNASYGVEDLYEWREGALRLVTVLPDGTAAAGSLAETSNGTNATESHAISAEGSRILFTLGGGLYVRIGGERTVQVDATQGHGSSGGGSFQAASADGSTIFFLDANRLTAHSTAQAGEPDLYECVLPEHANHCELSDLTVATAGEHADVQNVSELGGKDSSQVYFVAKGVLATNEREYTTSEGHLVREHAEIGHHNLYMWDGGTTTFIATPGEGDSGLGVTSPDGTWFAFDSRKSLTGYDNLRPLGPGEEFVAEEIFLYGADSGRLVCASCNPIGEPPVDGGGATLETPARRPLSNGGRLFFETHDALVPSDTDGQVDVYEYENEGVSLISSGASLAGEYGRSGTVFVGASESGDDVFFSTNQQLLPQDTQAEAQVMYDARVDGGIAAPSSPPPCTTADACRVPVAPLPSVFGAPASATFSGAGNLVPPVAAKPMVKPKAKPVKCRKGFVKKKGRCVKRPRKRTGKSAHANKRGH